MTHPTTTRMAVIAYECTEADAEIAKIRLSHVKAAGVLQSYDGAAFWDASTGKLTVYLDANRLHPANRCDFSCERRVAEIAIERAISLHRTTSRPPPSEQFR